MARTKKTDENKCWQGCGDTGTFLHGWWECKTVRLQNRLMVLPNVKRNVTIGPSNSAPSCTPEGVKNSVHTKTCTQNDHGSMTHKSHKVKTTQMSVNG